MLIYGGGEVLNVAPDDSRFAGHMNDSSASSASLLDLTTLTPAQGRILTLALHDRSARLEMALEWEQKRSEQLESQLQRTQSNRGFHLIARILRWDLGLPRTSINNSVAEGLPGDR